MRHRHRAKGFTTSRPHAVITLAAGHSAELATPLEQLQGWLENAGGSTNALNLAYKKCVAARKLQQGEVCLCRQSLLPLTPVFPIAA